MKAVKIIFAILLGLIVVIGLGLFIFVKTFNLNKHLPQITAELSKSLGRTVNISKADLNLSFSRGIYLQLSDLSIADDERFSKEAFFVLPQAQLGVQILSLLTKHTIDIGDIVLTHPSIQIIRDAKGMINAQTIATPTDVSTETGATPEPPQAKASKSSSVQGLPALSIKSIVVNEAQVHFVDLNPAMPLDIHIPVVNIKVEGLSWNNSFDITANAQVFANGPNIFIKSKARLDMAASAMTVEHTDANLDLATIDAAQLKTLSPILAQAPLPKSLSGQLTATVPSFTVGANGVSGFNAAIVLTNGTIGMPAPIPSLSSVSISSTVDLADVHVKEFSLGLGGGKVTGTADLLGYVQSQSYKFNAKLDGLFVEQLVDQKDLPVGVKGKLSGQVSGGSQSFDPMVALRNMNVQGDFRLNEGVLERLNISKIVLGSVLGKIPGLAEMADGFLAQKINDAIGDESNVIDQAGLKFNMHDLIVVIEDGFLNSKPLTVKAKGTMPLRGETQINVSTIFTKETTDKIVSKVKELESLKLDDGLIHVDGIIGGELPNLKFTPDVDISRIGRNVAVNEGSKALDKVIEKNPEVGQILNAVFGGNKDAAASGDQGAADSQGQSKSKELINNVLGNIFK